ncbi:hypothetical protein HY625_01210 [Candidatus Uhrbacteria bacterium]|nr:hypothetical protein [Candidatus Uhrbacteria bacterium]
MVVVLGIFLVAMTAATSIFVSAHKASARTVALTRTSGDARWVMEKMVGDIRLATVDYASLRLDGEGKASQLFLRTQEGKLVGYGMPSDADRVSVCGGASGCIMFFPEDSTTPARITGNSIAVKRLDFYVWPQKDPFVLASDGRALGQPRVTIVLDTETVGGKKEEQSHLSLQTTVSTRVYKR